MKKGEKSIYNVRDQWAITPWKMVYELSASYSALLSIQHAVLITVNFPLHASTLQPITAAYKIRLFLMFFPPPFFSSLKESDSCGTWQKGESVQSYSFNQAGSFMQE